MKLSETALLEIVEILRKGLEELRDVSVDLREYDLEQDKDGKLTLSKKYLAAKGRLI